MTDESNLPDRITASLLAAERRPGWNNRGGRIERFTLGSCQLIVVPCKRWAYRRQERQVPACWSRPEARR